jgi:hypothetical protein
MFKGKVGLWGKSGSREEAGSWDKSEIKGKT